MRWLRRFIGGGLGLVLAGVAPVAAQGLPTPSPQDGPSGTASLSAPPPWVQPGPGAAAASEPPEIDEGTYTVTLITGDRVTVTRSRDGQTSVAVTPAARADGSLPTFSRMAWQGHFYVIPHDVSALVPAQLDRRLFDVTGLIAAGFDDAEVDSVPVLVQTSEPGTSTDPAAGVDWRGLGVARGKSLKSIGSVAGKVPKAEGGEALVEAVRENAESPAARRVDRPAVSKVWLDGPVRALDATSTPQVGAPQAWAAGATGDGVMVAVLDTGVDAEHPDLADAVVAAQDFSFVDDPENPDDQPNPDDIYGHGTHVAGIITGNGAASNGEIVGVAPDAVIMNGKVLDDSGFGSDSQIIAGMEWAAAEGADVVNMSLGLPGGYTDGTDPLAMAVDELSAAHDVLFVIAAGNEGGYGTITTPGSSALALTVSAVNSADEPTGFTSRGPRSDGGAKPDIAAPGEDILAPWVGWPDAPEPYLSASGTSMAAPHVAGVAALLAQARPQLDSQKLKAVLVGSAEDVAASVLDVGSGRVFAPSALDQQVYATPSALGFGIFPYPQTETEAVTQTLVYTNLSSADVTLSLTADAALQDGTPAPAGTLTLGADSVTVPGGGSAEVTVTVDPAVAGVAAGRIGGTVIATDGGGETVRTAVMSVNEPEMYNLTIRATSRDGSNPGFAATAAVTPLADQEASTFEQLFPVFDEDGTATVRLPVGPYGVTGIVPQIDLETFDISALDAVSVPEVDLTAETTVHLDATRAVPVQVRTQRPSEQTMVDQQLTRLGEQSGTTLGYGAFGPVSVGAVPSEAVTIGELFWMHRHLRLPPSASLDSGDYRYLYDLAYVERDRLPARLRYEATKKTTTQVMADYNVMSDASTTAFSGRLAMDPSGWAFATALPVRLPIERDEYVSSSPDIQWFGLLDVLSGAAVIETPQPWTTEPGGRITERWLHQVHHHSTVDGFVGALFGEIFAHAVATASDDHGHGMFAVFDESVAQSRTRLWFDGQLVADEPGAAAVTTEIPEPGTPVRALVETAFQHPEWARSSAYSTDWRYLAPPVAGEDGIAQAEVVNIRYGATGLDDYNSTKRTARLELSVVDGTGEPAAGVRGIRLWISGDQGRTWQEVTVPRSGVTRKINVVAPKGATSISLKAEAWTRTARVTDTVIDAFALR
ncbi:S8 family serine peptidase [Nostocoides sp. F2B08]|uniref:S8 family peptidase n=1 Tax=Nostocoides sp. F2B08 TaxID=2653936 RepID=UPI001263B7CE|nr:S8 family serine peptidase [Tetrasphaera sp. F2B08]KAB7745586.1 S8 family serine peptidase [Tetrasphaera sp. F2B08]